MKLDDVEIISELGEEAEKPVEILLQEDRQSQLHAVNRRYRVVENGSFYLVLEQCSGEDRLHRIDQDNFERREIGRYEETSEASEALRSYSNSCS